MKYKLKCSVCGKTKIISRRRNDPPKYCSYKCRADARLLDIAPAKAEMLDTKKGWMQEAVRENMAQVRKWRKEGLSYAAIDKLLGVGKGTTQRANYTRPSYKRKTRICQCCGVNRVPPKPVNGVVLTRLCERCWRADYNERYDSYKCAGYSVRDSQTNPSMGWFGI